MQVSCSHCGAQYEFDAAAIPAAGYDAQCTTCNGVFFVSPAAEATATEVTVACSNCGAVYQFSAAAIPPSGYDAQCTQCQAVFFVGPQTIRPASDTAAMSSMTTTELREPATDDIPLMAPTDFSSQSEVMRNPLLQSGSLAAEATRPINVPTMAAPAAEPRGFAPQALHSGTMELDLEAAEVEPSRPEQTDVPEQQGEGQAPVSMPRARRKRDTKDDFSDVMAINAELGEPMGQPASHLTAEEEVEAIRERRSHRWMLALAAVLGVFALGGLMYWVAPRTFDMTVGRFVGIKRTVDPAAVPFVDKGLTDMLEDTDEAYANAIKEFAQALKVDPLYPDALALGAVAQTWRGSDLQAVGAELVQTSLREQAQIRGYQELSAAARTPQLISKLLELQHAARTHREKGTDLLETGGHYISDGMEWLLRGRRHFPKSPLMAEAEAICYAIDPDALARADKALARSLELRYGPKSPPRAGGPPDAWVPFVQGSIHATEKGGAEQAEELWLTTLKEEPKFQRTRWLLARLYVHTGQREAAKHVLDDILTAIPTHAKAKALLATLVAPAEPAAPVLPGPEAGAGHTKGKAKHVRHR